jgi:hypothetical protein
MGARRGGSDRTVSRCGPPTTTSSRPPLVRWGHAFGLGQPRGQDPDQLRRRHSPNLGPGVGQVVLDGRVRQAEAVGGRLLRPGGKYRGHDHDLTARGASGGTAGRPAGNDARTRSQGSGGSARRIVIGRSLVAGQSLSPGLGEAAVASDVVTDTVTDTGPRPASVASLGVREMAPPAGLEPAANCLEGSCSIR